jgi:hypothetical protein
LRADAIVTESNRMAEVTFESDRDYADPFNHVVLDVVVTTPDGRLLRVPAFWAGGKTWRIRYASSVPGKHTIRTECNDTSNPALHGVTGEIEVRPYSGDNPLFRHGPIRVAEDRRHFAHADGTPFFWLGDTWWMGFASRLRWPEDFQELAADRREKGFTVIQIVAGLYPDMPAFDERSLGDGGYAWEPLYTRIRPEYFDAADRRVQYLVEQGLMPCIVGGWGYHLPWLGTDHMKQHWRYLIGRWGALPVVWCAAGEQAMPWYNSGNKQAETELLRREWTGVIRYIRATDPFQRLLTTHPRRNARDEVTDPTVLDFEMQQTGHGSPTTAHAALALEAWNRPPFVPVLSGESRYEALEIQPPVSAKDAREAFWAHLLYSGCAGHTYGANGIWQVNLPEQRYGKSPGGHDWGGTPWREAMDLPGSTHLAHAKRFLQTLPWHQLAPASGFAGAISAATTPDGDCAVVYLVGSNAATVDFGRFNGPVMARWFDPTAGALKPVEGSPFPNSGSRIVTPPGTNAAGDSDWVLVLQAEDE